MRVRRTSRRLFTGLGLADLRSFVGPTTLFAFDLDGTLAPIAARPERIVVSETTQKELAILAARASVAIITGRGRLDAQTHLGIVPQFLIGNHGAEGLPGWEKQEEIFFRICLDWEGQLEKILPLERVSGIRVENKGTTLSIHYRAARDSEKTQSVIVRGVDALVPRPRRVTGKLVENLLPENAPDKGAAMLYLLKLAKSPNGFYVGDDATDEDVFRLGGDSLFTVRVGCRGATSARYGLANQRDIIRLLNEINQTLAEPRHNCAELMSRKW
jgi:trehalose 6-phosphate phosphatase